MSPYVPTYRDITVTTSALGGIGPVNVHYIEAGNATLPTVLLLHGFPSSSMQYRDLIPMLSNSYHILAPDPVSYTHLTLPTIYSV